jgi:hypothetical protein
LGNFLAKPEASEAIERDWVVSKSDLVEVQAVVELGGVTPFSGSTFNFTPQPLDFETTVVLSQIGRLWLETGARFGNVVSHGLCGNGRLQAGTLSRKENGHAV